MYFLNNKKIVKFPRKVQDIFETLDPYVTKLEAKN